MDLSNIHVDGSYWITAPPQRLRDEVALSPVNAADFTGRRFKVVRMAGDGTRIWGHVPSSDTSRGIYWVWPRHLSPIPPLEVGDTVSVQEDSLSINGLTGVVTNIDWLSDQIIIDKLDTARGDIPSYALSRASLQFERRIPKGTEDPRKDHVSETINESNDKAAVADLVTSLRARAERAESMSRNAHAELNAARQANSEFREKLIKMVQAACRQWADPDCTEIQSFVHEWLDIEVPIVTTRAYRVVLDIELEPDDDAYPEDPEEDLPDFDKLAMKLMGMPHSVLRACLTDIDDLGEA